MNVSLVSQQLTHLSDCIFKARSKTAANNHLQDGDYNGIIDLMFPLVPGANGEREPNVELIKALPFEGRHTFRSLMELMTGERLSEDQKFNLMTELNLLRHSDENINEMMAEDMDAILSRTAPAPAL